MKTKNIKTPPVAATPVAPHNVENGPPDTLEKYHNNYITTFKELSARTDLTKEQINSELSRLFPIEDIPHAVIRTNNEINTVIPFYFPNKAAALDAAGRIGDSIVAVYFGPLLDWDTLSKQAAASNPDPATN